jgi:integrase
VTRLTVRMLESIRPERGVRFHWDAEMPGFGLRVSCKNALDVPTLAFVAQYRNADGRTARMTLGRWPQMRPEAARKRAQQVLAAAARGEDPATELSERRSAPTVADLLDRFMSEHVEKRLSVATRADYAAIVARHLKPAFGRRKVRDVARADVTRWHSSHAHIPRQANAAVAVLSKAMNMAEEWGLRAENSNPCRRVQRYEENRRERFLSDAELAAIGAALREAQSRGLPWRLRADLAPEKARHRAAADNQRTFVSATALDVIRLLLYTGARRGELLSLEWAHVSFERGELMLPEKKGGRRRAHPVGAEALALLSRRQRRGPYVFPRDGDDARHITASVLQAVWERVRAAAGVGDVRLHDLRHTVGTYASETGANAYLLRDLLRHKTAAMTDRYVNRADRPVRVLSDRIGARIAAGLAGVAAPATSAAPRRIVRSLRRGAPRAP